MPMVQHFGHATVEGGIVLSRLAEVAQHDHRGLLLLAARQEVEGNVERGEVGIVGIVDEGEAAHAGFHFEAHRDGLQLRHAFPQFVECG